MKESNHTIDKKVQKLLDLLLGIYQKGVVKEVILGYEPADDDIKGSPKTNRNVKRECF